MGRGMEITTRPRSRRWRRLAGWLSLFTGALAACLLLLASLGLSQHVVADGAMGGYLARGALLFERPVQTADQLNVGDVITFPSPDAPDALVTRRVVSIDGSQVVTRGDAMPGADPWVLEVDGIEPALTVFAVPFAGYPQLLAPWLTWLVLAVLAGLATLAALLVARREASRDHCIIRAVPDVSAAAAL
jgi:signal peptidase